MSSIPHPSQSSIAHPQGLVWNEAHGFVLRSDQGEKSLLQIINPQEPPPLNWYLKAVDVLLQWQLSPRQGVMPVYDRPMLMQELELFPHWYVGEHHQFTLDAAQRQVVDDAFAKIVANNLNWPCVHVHRDFTPANLVFTKMAPTLSAGASSLPPGGAHFALGRPGGETLAPTLSDDSTYGRLAIRGFQDAVNGPITYDIASLMRDAFLSWEEDFCLDVTIRYWEKARKAGLPVGSDFGEFYKGVEWMGLQRHLRTLGVCARADLRDGKPQYLAEMPRFIDYIRATCSRYMELKPLLRLVERIEGIPVPTAYAFGRV